MTTRATFTVTIDIPTSRTADKMAAYIENMLDYLHATAKVVRPPEAEMPTREIVIMDEVKGISPEAWERARAFITKEKETKA